MNLLKSCFIASFFCFCLFACNVNDDEDSNTDFSGLYDFYLYDIVNDSTTKITESTDKYEYSFSISPDSKSILYVDYNGINIMNIDGTENIVISTEGTYPSYSPDGQKIAFIDDKGLYLMSVDGSNKQQIYNGNVSLWYPLFSKDGEKILCCSENGLCAVSMDGSLQSICSDNSQDWYDWSNDSKEVYYCKTVSGNYVQIFKFNFTDNVEYQLTNIESYNYSPKYNPVKDEIAFSSGSNIVFIDTEGAIMSTIETESSVNSVCWSPDGTKLAYINGNGNVVIIDAEGDNYQVINENEGYCWEFRWSADGQYILYYRAVFYD